MIASARRAGRKWPLAIDLFSGCGGLTLGLKQARFRVVGAVDNDPLSVKSYKLNHRAVRVWSRDIRDLPAAEVMRELRLKPGELDLLAGCPPCQGFSSLRTLNRSRRVRDPRNNLHFEFLRFASVMKPRTIMLENVPGLAKHSSFKRFLAGLRKLGYTLTYKILDAADYGVPQRRHRLILLGSKNKLGRVQFAAPSSNWIRVRDAIGQLPHPTRSRDPLHSLNERRSKRIRKMIKSIPPNGGSRRHLKRQQLACHRRCNGFNDVYGRMSWNSVAPTITSGCINPSKGRFLHPRANRAITLREAALLQSFPPLYRFALDRGRFATAALIGNALPPELVRRQAVQINSVLASRDQVRP